MSSFVCSAKHFNSIQEKLNSLFCYDVDFHFYHKKFPVITDRSNKLYEAIEEEINTIMDDLRRLSVICVTLQYAHHYEGEVDKEIKQQTDNLIKGKTIEPQTLTMKGLYNALRCVNYQIEIERYEDIAGKEGKPQDAFIFLEYMLNNVAHYLAAKMPDEAGQTTWEIA